MVSAPINDGRADAAGSDQLGLGSGKALDEVVRGFAGARRFVQRRRTFTVECIPASRRMPARRSEAEARSASWS